MAGLFKNNQNCAAQQRQSDQKQRGKALQKPSFLKAMHAVTEAIDCCACENSEKIQHTAELPYSNTDLSGAFDSEMRTSNTASVEAHRAL